MWDVILAGILAMNNRSMKGDYFNVGTGAATSISELGRPS